MDMFIYYINCCVENANEYLLLKNKTQQTRQCPGPLNYLFITPILGVVSLRKFKYLIKGKRG